MDITNFFSKQSPPCLNTLIHSGNDGGAGGGEDTTSQTSFESIDLEKMCQSFNADPHTKRYFINLDKIGEGGYGLVFRGQHKFDKKMHALKIMLNDVYGQREIEMLAAMNHQNVVRYITSWDVPLEESDVSDYLIMQTELCQPEESLQVLIDNGKFIKMDMWNPRNMVLDIIGGVKYIHEQGIMHRDLKPTNILIGMDNLAKIADFGFARKYLTSHAEANSATSKEKRVPFSTDLGTELYIAPEVMTSNNYDFKVDYYSLGIIIFEVYCNKTSVRDRHTTILELRKMNFKDLDDILKDFRNVSMVVKNLLNHDASLREPLDWVTNIIEPINQVSVQAMSIHDVESPAHDRVFSSSEQTLSEEREQIVYDLNFTQNVIDYL